MTFVWSPVLSVGVLSIDAQHQELFQRVNALLLALGSHREEQEVLGTLAFLGDYVVSHFEDEERLMRETGYPGLAVQIEEHKQFTDAFRRLRAKFARRGIDGAFAKDVEGEVCGWLVRHVQGTDRALGQWLTARGLASR